MAIKKLHYVATGGDGRTSCGRVINGDVLETHDPMGVTCLACRRTLPGLDWDDAAADPGAAPPPPITRGPEFVDAELPPVYRRSWGRPDGGPDAAPPGVAPPPPPPGVAPPGASWGPPAPETRVGTPAPPSPSPWAPPPPPGGWSATPAPAPAVGFRSARFIFEWYRIFLCLAMAGVAVLVGINVVMLAKLPPRTEDDFNLIRRLDGPVRTGVFRIILALLVVALVLWCVWLYRSYRNQLSFGVQGLSHSPGAAVGLCFVPFYGYVHSPRIHRELWRTSDPGAVSTPWQNRPLPAALRNLTVLLIAYSVFQTASNAVVRSIYDDPETTLSRFRFALGLAAVAAMVSILLAATLMRIMERITSRQEAFAAAGSRSQ